MTHQKLKLFLQGDDRLIRVVSAERRKVEKSQKKLVKLGKLK
jgi:hypothetical protein